VNCYDIEVRGVTFRIWAPTIQDALETFMIDMEFYEVPKELAAYPEPTGPASEMFPPHCGGF